jgi:hypothetical protein
VQAARTSSVPALRVILMAFFLMASAAFDGGNAHPDHVRERQDDDDQKETSAAYRKSLAIG